MPLKSPEVTPAAHPLEGRTVAELLLLVGDAEHGFKSEAMRLLLGQGLAANFAVYEAAVRNDDEADLRNGAMEMLVKFGEESVPGLALLLADPNEEVRNFCAVMLGDIGSRTAVGALVGALADAETNVSHAAAEALGKIGDRAAVEPLLGLLQGDLWLQFAAITALGELRDPRAVSDLIRLLDDELLAPPVAEALGKLGDSRALKPLARILSDANDALASTTAQALVAINRCMNDQLNFKNTLAEDHPEQLKNLLAPGAVAKLRSLLQEGRTRESVEAAVTLLGWVGDVAALEDFLPLVADESYLPVVESAIVSLGAPAQTALFAALRGGNDQVRLVALRSLRWLGAACDAEELAGILASSKESLQIEVLETLKHVPCKDLLPQVMQVVEEGSEEASRKGCEVLGACSTAEVRELLWRLARCENPMLRRRGALLLRYLPGCGGVDALELLTRDQEPEVRWAAIRAIGVQRVPEGRVLLKQALGDPDEVVREAAVMAAADFGTALLVDELVALLGSGSKALDYEVIRTLGLMKAREAGAHLLEYFGAGEVTRELAYALVEALGRICCRESSELISSRYLKHEDPDFRRLAVETLGKLGDTQSLRGVEEAASDPHWSVRIAALHVLGKIGGVREIPLVLQALHDPDAMVRKHAIVTLGEVRDVSSIPTLVEQLCDPDMGRHAFEALLKFGRSGLAWLHRLVKKEYPVELRERIIDVIGKVGAGQSVTPLMGLLEDPSEAVRLAAIDALSYCYDSLPLKKLMQVKNNDASEEVKSRADLALRTFAVEKYC
jgi:HEAT repeat protein